MIRAFQLEWLKLRHYRVFWILFGLYLLAQLFITNGGILILNWLEDQGADFNGLTPSIIPIYDFPDIWQNTTWLASYVKILIAFIVIISVNNDLTYNTLRQNIIDGISKKEFVLSKFSIILFLAAICTVALFISGLVTGFIHSNTTDIAFVFDELEFLLAYFLQLVLFSMFAFCIALLIKKAGFAIVLLTLYSFFLEPIATAILEYAGFVKDYTTPFVKFFPVYSTNALVGHFIEAPFQKYLFREIEDNVRWYEWFISLGWLVAYFGFIYFRLTKRDLKA